MYSCMRPLPRFCLHKCKCYARGRRRFWWGIMCRLIYLTASREYKVMQWNHIGSRGVNFWLWALTSKAQLKKPTPGAAYLTRVGWKRAALSLHKKKKFDNDKPWGMIWRLKKMLGAGYLTKVGWKRAALTSHTYRKIDKMLNRHDS